MIDGIIKADGTSRLMRAELPATYEEFRTQCRTGTQPLDVLFNEDGWSQLPTFLNKANLLKDTTASLFYLGAAAVPDDVLRVLSRFQNGLGNEYVWAKTKSGFVEELYAQETAPYYIVNPLPADMPYSDSVGFNEDGSVYLVNPQTYTITADNYTAAASFLSGKYIDTSSTTASQSPTPGITKLPANSVFTRYNSLLYLKNQNDDKTLKIFVRGVSETVHYGYVNSPDPNAYPVDDGYTYTALGQFGAKVQIATGSYTGTGTYGVSNPNSLTFDFVPKIVKIVAWEQSGNVYPTATATSVAYETPAYLMTGGYVEGFGFTSNVGNRSYGRMNGQTLEWYNTNSASVQCNQSNTIYHYIAIG